MENNTYELTQGNIFYALVKMALPIMGMSFLQMAYNLTDMIWIGRVGSDEVASVGTAGFYIWLSFAVVLLSKTGAEVLVAQNVGARNFVRAKDIARNALQQNFLLAIIYGLIIIFFNRQLILFFNIQNDYVNQMAIAYLKIIGYGMIFMCSFHIFSAILIGSGDSKTPFKITAIGLIINMVLDPILIFGLFKFPSLGVEGAAIATIIAQIIVSLIFILYIRKNKSIFSDIHFLKIKDVWIMKRLMKLGFPTALNSALFTIFAMIIARIISQWGALPIAVQKVGSQIESITWLTAGGFSAAMSAFVGQNYGAKNWKRLKDGYYTAFKIAVVLGIVTTMVLILFAQPIFAIFIPEDEAIKMGVDYLRILGVSQLFMCIEITTAGAFNGLGKTLPPSIVSILFNALRIPMAIYLSTYTALGLNGVWWSISISSICKGIVLSLWYRFNIYKYDLNL